MKFSEIHHLPPRAWISPQGKVIELTGTGTAHYELILKHPDVFWIDKAFIDQLTKFWKKNKMEFDTFYLIALAENNGWVRISPDTSQGIVSICGTRLTNMQKAVAWLVDEHGIEDNISVEKEMIVLEDNGTHGSIHAFYYLLNNKASVKKFQRLGQLPQVSQQSEVPIRLPPPQ